MDNTRNSRGSVAFLWNVPHQTSRVTTVVCEYRQDQASALQLLPTTYGVPAQCDFDVARNRIARYAGIPSEWGESDRAERDRIVSDRLRTEKNRAPVVCGWPVPQVTPSSFAVGNRGKAEYSVITC